MKFTNFLSEIADVDGKSELAESRYTLKGRKVKSVKTGEIGEIIKEEAYGTAYTVQWNNGSIQHLGRSSLCNTKKYLLLAANSNGDSEFATDTIDNMVANNANNIDTYCGEYI